ncbi:hypothetical protein [Citrobacter freundii]|uniref:hypothetical protein n=1 Tax=Citrobacter freundii TaxID=546 RepID=UPI003D7E9CF8
MSHDAEIIAKAIEALKPTQDYLKDYIFPVTLAFFSALLGGASAVYINKRQDFKNVTKENFVSSLQIYNLAHECLSNLVAIKVNYQHIESDEPLIRANQIPTLLTKLDDITYNTQTLYFIKPIRTANKSLLERCYWNIKHHILKKKIEVPDYKQLRNSWRNTVRINAMFSNYNEIMRIARFRNDLNEQVKHLVSQASREQSLPIEKIQHILGANLCGGYVDVTESFIALTDYVMVELYEFLLKFPEIAESNIELRKIKELGRLPVVENREVAFLQSMKPIVKPDYKKLAKYTGASEEQLLRKNTYSNLV